MNKALVPRLVFTVLCVLLLTPLGASPAAASNSVSGSLSTSINEKRLHKVSADQYEILQSKFSSAEIGAIDEISTKEDINELVLIVENPTALAPSLFGEKSGVVPFAAPNGCNFSPDSWGRANFKPSCDRHDICYGSSTNRFDCDTSFLAGLTYECGRAYPNEAVRRTACINLASTYYAAVRAAGSTFYKGTGANN